MASVSVCEFVFMLTCFRGDDWCSGCDSHWHVGLCYPVRLRHPVVLQVRLYVDTLALDFCHVAWNADAVLR